MEFSLRIFLGKDADVHRFLVSLWSSVGFVGLGASVLVFGPTLLDLGASLGVGVAVMSAMFGARASGAAVGSIGLGYAMDRWSSHSYTILTLVLATCIISTVLIPLSPGVYVLALFMLFNGIATGSLDSATHALLMRLWKDKSGPCMQVLHFAFAFGAFIAPLIAKQFVSEVTSTTEDSTIAPTLTNFTTFTHYTADLPSFNDTLPDDTPSTRFRVAYWIVSATYLPTLAAYLYFAIKFDFLKDKKVASAQTLNITSDDNNEEEEDEVKEHHLEKKEFEMQTMALEEEPHNNEVHVSNDHAASEDESSSEKEELIFVKKAPKTKKVSPDTIVNSILSSKATRLMRYRYAILLLIALFLFVYVGLEVAYGSLIFTATVIGPLQFSKSNASLIQALFWGLFAFGRLFSIALVLFKVRSSLMISMNLAGSLVASLIMIIFVHSSPAIWLASVVLGASYSSIYPTAMTWMSENMEATGLATAVLITGGVLGDIILPAVVGAFIAAVSADMLFYLTFVGVIISSALAGGMFLAAHRKWRFEQQSSPGKFRRLQVVNGRYSTKEEAVKLMEVREQSDEEDADGHGLH